MALDRRHFLKIAASAAAASGAVMTGAEALASAEKAARKTGQRYAMVIDTGKLAGNPDEMEACVKACNRAHNIPEFNSAKEEVKWIWAEPYEHVFPNQHHEFLSDETKESPVLALCNHCENPPCVRVCPTQATFKRKDGIVAMDQHRCIGCRFCIAACPYGSRSFNWRDPRPGIKDINPKYPTRTKGVVEKCNFCAERLAKKQQPACVEASKSGAIVFGDILDPKSDVRKALQSNYTIRRKPELGTQPHVFYIVSKPEDHNG